MVVGLQAIALEPHKLATKVAGDFTPATFTCANYTAAKGGARRHAGES